MGRLTMRGKVALLTILAVLALASAAPVHYSLDDLEYELAGIDDDATSTAVDLGEAMGTRSTSPHVYGPSEQTKKALKDRAFTDSFKASLENDLKQTGAKRAHHVNNAATYKQKNNTATKKAATSAKKAANKAAEKAAAPTKKAVKAAHTKKAVKKAAAPAKKAVKKAVAPAKQKGRTHHAAAKKAVKKVAAPAKKAVKKAVQKKSSLLRPVAGGKEKKSAPKDDIAMRVEEDMKKLHSILKPTAKAAGKVSCVGKCEPTVCLCKTTAKPKAVQVKMAAPVNKKAVKQLKQVTKNKKVSKASVKKTAKTTEEKKKTAAP